MLEEKFDRLLRKGFLTAGELAGILAASRSSGKYPEELLLEKGIPKHEILFCLSEYYNCPFAEYDEGLMSPYLITMRLELEKHKRALWYPLAVKGDTAEVVAYDPGDSRITEDIRKTLGIKNINFRVALPADVTRIIENNFDVNPGFPFSGGRTPLALVRVFLAYRRSTFAHYRTLFAKGRTGLAFVRTGLAFIAISLTFLRVFGTGLWAVLEVPFILLGLVMIFDGTKWYIPSRAVGRCPIDNSSTEPAGGTSMLTVSLKEGHPVFRRTGVVEGAEKLRAGWDRLSPVMRRRFIACDRSDFAEERTALAGHRTVLAKARTGLAFTRTGIAFAGMGIGLIRHFHASGWTVFDVALIVAGVLMSAEGFYWYLGGRQAGIESFRAVRRMNMKENIWDFVIPLRHKRTGPRKDRACPPVHASHFPGVWATTGLALERTVLAERRCVMARLRTVMARARTGLAFIRTGISITAVGAGLMVFFGVSAVGWTIFNTVLIVGGLTLVVDGFYWAVPAEKIRAQYPYCYGDMEITVPDYGKPARRWGKAVFSHDDI